MKAQIVSAALLLLIGGGMQACKKAPQKANSQTSAGLTENKGIVTQTLSYTNNGKAYKSFLAFDESKKGELPVVFIIPEWWGMNDYVKRRAEQLAGLGYMAVAIDMYGDGKVVDNPDDAGKLAKPFYGNADLAKQSFEAALKQVQNIQKANKTKMAAIGYCFGGAMALNMARINEPLKGVVSFHGNLMSGVKPVANNVSILVLNGADDTFVSKDEIASFKKEMDSAKIQYKFVDYPGAVHSFTNPDATETGKKYNMKVAYNEAADKASWEEMKGFLNKIFK
ncbi:dienelactone hydrolase family protein [Elizabethkingia meningoseptica]|uniref:dienelactone hydrolase family protein n=1 Tax=Elizabethkingia meningoseptica TaxID=238 RepID=UPI0023B0143A|nr:dienelactone hydrolase family protein [Elizabethkingia meningoseptica]MDE5466743.1 dienelactone hydrolase family protein [Elizabethkingia meningoseptica]MDE5474027.1 dienelactone hydrolase family protein [Elizabethkingia meningoseptica]MDE5477460.1 dienelactone hydrolase family protein [Elizabethkingia meningoseptica]MDE5484062.1 dienelactone hydrolase family protein [Elizabethkingia meningoseptica]MDE5500859.1 dienelactone hydrolase family protein [Elizabethkingia meningoseptica]